MAIDDYGSFLFFSGCMITIPAHTVVSLCSGGDCVIVPAKQEQAAFLEYPPSPLDSYGVSKKPVMHWKSSWNGIPQRTAESVLIQCHESVLTTEQPHDPIRHEPCHHLSGT